VVAVARRSVLIGGTVGAGLLVAGCTSGGPDASAPTTPPPDPLLAELADERRLVAAYDATVARYPALRGRLAAVRADHAAHAAALVTALGPAAPTPDATAAGSAAPTAGATATPAATATPGATAVPGTATAALAALRAAERAAASARGTVALTAPADRARLLAGISACESSHLVVLG